MILRFLLLLVRSLLPQRVPVQRIRLLILPLKRALLVVLHQARVLQAAAPRLAAVPQVARLVVVLAPQVVHQAVPLAVAAPQVAALQLQNQVVHQHHLLQVPQIQTILLIPVVALGASPNLLLQ